MCKGRRIRYKYPDGTVTKHVEYDLCSLAIFDRPCRRATIEDAPIQIVPGLPPNNTTTPAPTKEERSSTTHRRKAQSASDRPSKISFWSLFRRHSDETHDKKDKKRKKKHALQQHDDSPSERPPYTAQAPDPPPAATWHETVPQAQYESAARSPPLPSLRREPGRISQSLRTSWAPTDTPIIFEERVPPSRRPSGRHGRRTSNDLNQQAGRYSTEMRRSPYEPIPATENERTASDRHTGVQETQQTQVPSRSQSQRDTDPLGERRRAEARARQREATFRQEQERAQQENLELKEHVRQLTTRLAAVEARQSGHDAQASAQGNHRQNKHSRHHSAYQAPSVTALDDDGTSFEDDDIRSTHEQEIEVLEPAMEGDVKHAHSMHISSERNDHAAVSASRDRPRPPPINSRIESASNRGQETSSARLNPSASTSANAVPIQPPPVRRSNTHSRSASTQFAGTTAATGTRAESIAEPNTTRPQPFPLQRPSPLSRGPSTSRRSRADRPSFGTSAPQASPRYRSHLYERAYDNAAVSITEAQAHIDSARRGVQQKHLETGSSSGLTSAQGSNDSSKKASPAGAMRRSRHSVDLRADSNADRTRSVDGYGDQSQREIKDDEPVDDHRQRSDHPPEPRRRRGSRPSSWFV